MKERLGVSFKNSREMLSTLDQIPDRFGPWTTKRLSFKDNPQEFFTIRHRNPIEAIRGLWGDPAFAEHLVYKPARIFRNADRGKKKQNFQRDVDRNVVEWRSGKFLVLQNYKLAFHLRSFPETSPYRSNTGSGYHSIR